MSIIVRINDTFVIGRREFKMEKKSKKCKSLTAAEQYAKRVRLSGAQAEIEIRP
jgi:hypothetical protein